MATTITAVRYRLLRDKRALLTPTNLLMSASLASLLVFLALHEHPGISVLYYAIAIGAVAVSTWGAWRSHHADRRHWLLLALGIGVLVVADVAWDQLAASDAEMTTSLADPIYLLGYGLLGWALLGIFRIRAAEKADVVDALIVVVAAGSVLWIIVADGLAELGTLELIYSAAFPVLDLLLLGLVLVALFSSGRPDRVTSLLVGASLALLISDQAWVFVDQLGPMGEHLIETGWLTGYVLLALASVQPPRIERRRVRHDATGHLGWSPLRLMVLLAVAAVPLATIMLGTDWPGNLDVVLSTAATALMFALLAFRMELVIRRLRALLRERQALESSLQRQAAEDPLTGLANRRGLFDYLAAATAGGRSGLSLMMIDLDDFKTVNDLLGHPVGDALLRVIGDRLRRMIRAEDIVARLGGDEFAIVAHGFSTEAEVAALARRVLAALEVPVEIEGRRLVSSASIGVATTNLGDETVDDLMRDADNALCEAKDRGKHRWVIFDPQMRVRALRRLSIDGELSRAVAEQEFDLCYQPIVGVASGRIEWVEALLRWHHPSLGLLGPSDFLAAAERSSHMPALAGWVLEEAIRAAAAWRAAGHPDVGVSINLSTGQVQDTDLVETMAAILERNGLPPDRVLLELLESSFDTTPDLLERLDGLRGLGIRLALDDFGTGFSSLARLADVPVSVLKFDRSLVAGRRDPKLVGAVVRLGRSLGLYLVAEGVETKRELERMRRLGCDAIQGYTITRPLPPSRIGDFLDAWVPVPWQTPRPSEAPRAGSSGSRTARVRNEAKAGSTLA